MPTITTAVMCGLDTDCNGATVGSIVGAIHWQELVATPMARRLNDQMRPHIGGFGDVRLHDLAERTVKVWKTIRDHSVRRAK